jgi:hypothetical protein
MKRPLNSPLANAYHLAIPLMSFRKPGPLVGAFVALSVWTSASPHAGVRGPDAARTEPHAFLRSAAGFTATDLAALDRGEPIARVLDTDRREVAVVGAVRIKSSPAALFQRYRDISNLKGSDVVLEIGRFGTPPSADDLRGLHFEEYDLDTIRQCKPGNCGVRLSSANMDRFARDVNWNAPGWREQASALWRQLLAADAAAYLANGTLGDYRNKAEPLEVADEFNRIFESSRYFESISPEFLSYLKRFPSVRLDGAENILYWSKDDINRPVTRITHLILYPAPPGARRPGLIATKQIYAAHYFDAGLGFTCAFDDGTSGFYMLSVNRVRTRSLMSFTRSIVRSIVQRRSREAMEGVLRSTKAALER